MNKIKKINKFTASLLAVLMLVLAVAATPLTAKAAWTKEIRTAANAVSDTVVEFTVDAAQYNRISSGRIVISYDADVLSLSNAAESMRFDVSDVNTLEDGVVSYSFASEKSANRNGRMLTLRFDVKSESRTETTITTKIAELYGDNAAQTAMGETVTDTLTVGKPDRLQAPNIFSATVSTYLLLSRKVDLVWTSVDTAEGYEIYRSSNYYGSFSRVGTSKSASFRDTSVRKGQVYYYIVRAYRTENGKRVYSDNSNVYYVGVR